MTSTMTPTEATTAGPEENPAVHTLEVSAEQAAAIALVQQKAPDARFGRFVASPIPGQPDYQQVNRVDKHGLLLTDGWTFLVNSKTQAVTRTIADPHNLDFKEAQRRGVPC